jgi:hypothetical protein
MLLTTIAEALLRNTNTGALEVYDIVQAMAGFGGGGTTDGLNALALGTETTQPQLLTVPS